MSADGTASRGSTALLFSSLLLEDQNRHLLGHDLPGSGHCLDFAARRAGDQELVLRIGDSSSLLKGH